MINNITIYMPAGGTFGERIIFSLEIDIITGIYRLDHIPLDCICMGRLGTSIAVLVYIIFAFVWNGRERIYSNGVIAKTMCFITAWCWKRYIIVTIVTADSTALLRIMRSIYLPGTRKNIILRFCSITTIMNIKICFFPCSLCGRGVRWLLINSRRRYREQ